MCMISQFRNPAVLTSRPFSSKHHTISVKIDHLAVWVGIGSTACNYILIISGFCDETFTLTEGSVLGAQDKKLNSSLFQQKGTTLKVRFKEGKHKRISVKGAIEAVVAGDVITMTVNFEKAEATYFWNNTFLGTFD